MRIIVAVFLLVCSSIAVSSQSAVSRQTEDGKPPFTITISCTTTNPTLENSVDQTVNAGAPLGLLIRKTNTSNHEIIKWPETGGPFGDLFDLRDGSGHLLEPRKSNEVVTTSDGEGRIIGTKDMVLQPGESKVDFAPLSLWYDMNQPGTYTIQVSSHITNDPKSDIVKSNTITITVLPAESKPMAEIEPAEGSIPSADEPSPETTKQPFSIKINAGHSHVKVGDPVYVGIEMRNTSDHEIDCTAMTGNNGIDGNFQYEILDDNGDPAPKIAAGKTFPEAIPCTLKPENNYSTGGEISRIFDFSRPGKYTIQLSRPIWGNDQIPGTGRTVQNGQAVVKSNKITITVVAAEP